MSGTNNKFSKYIIIPIVVVIIGLLVQDLESLKLGILLLLYVFLMELLTKPKV